MNDMHTPEMLDDVAVYALGSLPAADALRVRAHIATCDECRAEYEALAATASAIGVAAETDGDAVASPSTLLKPRIMRVVRAEAAPAVSAPAATKKPPALWPPYLAAAACLAITIGSVISNVRLNWEVESLRSEVARTQQGAARLADRLTDETTELDDLTAAGAKRFAGSDGEVVTNGQKLYLAMHDLPAPPPGKVYQAWTLPKGSKTMQPSLTFTPDSHGVAVLSLPANAHNTSVVAVSVEPDGGSLQPTTKPVLVVPLT